MLYFLFPVSVANDVVIDQIFKDIVIGSVGIERVIFLEIYWELCFNLFKTHLSPSLTQYALKNFELIVNLWVDEPVFGESELFIKFDLFRKKLSQLFSLCYDLGCLADEMGINWKLIAVWVELRFNKILTIEGNLLCSHYNLSSLNVLCLLNVLREYDLMFFHIDLTFSVGLNYLNFRQFVLAFVGLVAQLWSFGKFAGWFVVTVFG